MRRSFFILIGVILLIAAVSAAALLVFRRGSGGNANQSQTNQTTANSAAVTNTDVTVPPDPERDAIMALAKNFTERYGSSSTDTAYQNLEEVLPWMTDAYRAAAEKDLLELRTRGSAGAFSSVTTKALAPAITAREPGKSAIVEVTAQRIERRGNTTDQPYRQTLKLELKASGSEWQVDRATWLPKIQG